MNTIYLIILTAMIMILLSITIPAVRCIVGCRIIGKTGIYFDNDLNSCVGPMCICQEIK